MAKDYVYILMQKGKPMILEVYPAIIVVRCYRTMKQATNEKQCLKLGGEKGIEILKVELHPKSYHPAQIRTDEETRFHMIAQDKEARARGEYMGM